jgi:hypothetical protein
MVSFDQVAGCFIRTRSHDDAGRYLDAQAARDSHPRLDIAEGHDPCFAAAEVGRLDSISSP